MDLPLLAVTALGFVGIYLMLPRDRKNIARLGGLVSVLALAGFFLYLIRQFDHTGGSGPSLLFYLFAAIMVFGSAGVVTHPKPINAALYFVLVTLAGAGLFVMLSAEFMAIVLIIVYAGAILVTYVFVLMLASTGDERKSAPAYDRIASDPLAAVFVSFLLLGGILQFMFPSNELALQAVGDVDDAANAKPPALVKTYVPVNTRNLDYLMKANLTGTPDKPAGEATTQKATRTWPMITKTPGNMQVLGNSLYTQYTISLELAGVLLTVALVGAVVISRKDAGTEKDSAGTGQLPNE